MPCICIDAALLAGAWEKIIIMVGVWGEGGSIKGNLHHIPSFDFSAQHFDREKLWASLDRERVISKKVPPDILRW